MATLGDAKYGISYYYEYPAGNKKSKTISDINISKDDTTTINSAAGMTVDMANSLATKITASIQGSAVIDADGYPRKIVETRNIEE